MLLIEGLVRSQGRGGGLSQMDGFAMSSRTLVMVRFSIAEMIEWFLTRFRVSKENWCCNGRGIKRSFGSTI